MAGNIIGEGFKDYVIDQINVRQSKLARIDRSIQQIQEENSKTAWIKLTSSIKILDKTKFEIPTNIEDLAKYFTLFGGTSINLNPLGGLNAYKQFDFEQGYRPAPGIVSMETENRNRGSVRESTVTLKAYSREQFYYIDLLYLRIGYSVLLEFGNSIYYDNREIYQKFTDTQTVTADFLGEDSSKFKSNHYALLDAIEEKRKETAGNYDAIFGQIRNYNWSFNPEGYYDISLSIISYGDIIESLKANVPATDSKIPLTKEEKENRQGIQSFLEQVTVDDQIIDILKNLDTIGNLFFKIKRDLQYSSVAVNTPNDQTTVRILKDTGVFGNTSANFNTFDAVGIVGNKVGEQSGMYYIRLGAFLKYLWGKGMLYVDKDSTVPLLKVDTDISSNLIYKTPYTFSTNPEICIVKTSINVRKNGKIQTYKLFDQIPEGGSFLPKSTDLEKYPDVGFLMNTYINLAYILKQGFGLKDKQNSINFYDLIQKICDGINECLGGINTLEPVIDEQECRLYILDQHPIPSIQQQIQRLAEFNIYGLSPGKQGSFVLDFGIETSITNELANIITIGAQANGTVKGADATAFATWNVGLEDRILPVKQNEIEVGTTENTGLGKFNLFKADNVRNTEYVNLKQEFISYLEGMVKYQWDNTKAEELSTIVSNMLAYTEGISGLTNKSTKGGSLGFIPINLKLTLDGISGMKIYQRFKVNQEFLPYNYPNTLQFIITGLRHKVSNNKWTTEIETNVVPETTIKDTEQDFSGLGSSTTSQNEYNPTSNNLIKFPSKYSSGTRLELYRSTDNGIQTSGELYLLNSKGGTIKKYLTVEKPWKNNENRTSCIPPGKYNFVKSISTNRQLGDVLKLSNPPYRDGILIHVGNKPSELAGCIAPHIKGGSSTAAMKEIINTLYPFELTETFTLEVYGVPGKEYKDYRNQKVYKDPT